MGTEPAPPTLTVSPDGVPTWEEVARDHGRFLYTVAYRLTGNDEDARDIVQDALLRVRRERGGKQNSETRAGGAGEFHSSSRFWQRK